MIKFIKWLLCLEPKQKEFPSLNNRLIMNERGNIRLNLDNPEVLDGLSKGIDKYRNFKVRR